MIKIDDVNNKRLRLLKNSVGLFCIIDYETPKGINTAKGRLDDVSIGGDVTVIHLKNKDIFWVFNIEVIKNSKFSPIRDDGGLE